MAILKHLRFTPSNETMQFQGIRTVEGHRLALLRRGSEIMVVPVDGSSAGQLRRLAIGDAVMPALVASVGGAKGRGR